MSANGRNTRTEYCHSQKDISPMMTQQIRFSQLENVLLGLGFEETRVRGSHVRFDNPHADAGKESFVFAIQAASGSGIQVLSDGSEQRYGRYC